MAEHWQPSRTWAFVVGLLSWQHEEIYSPFPTADRRDSQLVELLKQRGVPAAQIGYLQDRQATTAVIQRRLREHLAAAPADATLLLYYCGHGSLDQHGRLLFASYDADDDANPGWVAAELPALIEQHFRGNQALLLADCCHSGRLAETIVDRRGRVAFAALGSSLASELSTGNWTFTEAVLAGLRGEAYTDSDRNATITLAELAAHVRSELAFAEEQVASFAVSAAAVADLVMAPALPRRNPQIGRQVAARSEGSWYPAQIVDVRGEQLKVRFYGYERSEDAWVAADSVRNVGRPRYPIGTCVEVKWKSRWYPATILDERDGVHRVAYDDYGSEFHEWVSSQRIRPLI
jgi:uncharacterized caspase-like protein